MNIVNLTLSDKLIIPKQEISEGMISQIRAFLTLENPRYKSAKMRGYCTNGIEKFLFAYSETPDSLCCYRAYIGLLIPFLCRNGFKYKIHDQRRRLPEINFTFRGKLRDYQQRAVTEALKKHFGIIVAPCGSGKTTMALAGIAERKQPTIIITHTKDLLSQWKERIVQYLGIPENEIGVIGSGKESIGPVTVAMVQTLAKRDLTEIRKHFGQLIIDECHHCPASTFIEVASVFDSYFMMGLSATPYRKDRLNRLIFVSCGNIAAQVTKRDLSEIRIKPQIISRKTNFTFPYEEDADYVPMISALVGDWERNSLIAEDIAKEYHANGNYCLVLSDRKAHCETLAAILQDQGIPCAVLTGDLSKSKRESIIRRLDDGSLRVALATGQLAGEGLDIPKLNRLFITTPIRWRGRVEQYVGRILRTAAGKKDAKIYDYLDHYVGVLESAYNSRCRNVYEGLN